VIDYYSVLSRAVASLDANSAQARAELFDRARQMLAARIRTEGPEWTDADIQAELANLDAAIDRIESDIAESDIAQPAPRSSTTPPPPPPPATPASRDETVPRPNRTIALLGVLGLGGVVLVGLGLYLLRGGLVASAPHANAGAKATTAVTQMDDGEVQPGVDGGSTSEGLPYYLRRQVVYYRSVYTEGMIIVERSQRYLYLVQPMSRAIRYGIGVGDECTPIVGLHRITRKEEWPSWSPSPELLKRHAYPSKLAGGPGNPLGARAIRLDDDIAGIHGTNAPKSIGQSLDLGCIRLVNEDVVDLDKRVAVGAGVVVMD